LLSDKGMIGDVHRYQRIIATAAVLLCGSLQASANSSVRSAPQELASGQRSRTDASYGELPLRFELNQGESDPQVRFLARGVGYGLFISGTESVIALPRSDEGASVLQLVLVGASSRSKAMGVEELPGKSHYLKGNDRSKWRTGVPQFARVEVRDVYRGVNLAYYGNEAQLEYDFVVAPTANPGKIRFRIEGAKQVRLDKSGDLVLTTDVKEVVHHAPVAYQEQDGVRRSVAARYVRRGAREVAFEVGAYDHTRPLVIDPVLTFTAYPGGPSGADTWSRAVAIDASGNVYVTGTTWTADFETTFHPLQATIKGTRDAFVAKISSFGPTLLYSTYLGGSSVEDAFGIAVDASGHAYVTGQTASTDFPTVNPIQDALGTAAESAAFVSKLSADGAALDYSTYLGGSSGGATGSSIAVNSAGQAYVAGYTFAPDFPTVGAFQSTSGGALDAFVAKLGVSGSDLVYSTYLGGNALDMASGIALDSAGSAYVAGQTCSPDFPIVNALQATKAQSICDAFISKLQPSGSVVSYSTFLGGTVPAAAGHSAANGIAVDAAGSAYIAGDTYSTDFPTVNAFQTLSTGAMRDAFAAKLAPDGSALAYSTYLGGVFISSASAIAVDTAGDAYVSGWAVSPNFPAVHPVRAFPPSQATFLTKINATGSSLVYSTALPGCEGAGVAVDASGNAYVAGGRDCYSFLSMVDPTPAFSLDRSLLSLGVLISDQCPACGITAVTPIQSVNITFDPSASNPDAPWTATSDRPFVVVNPSSGHGRATFNVQIENVSTIAGSGTSATITVSALGASEAIAVELHSGFTQPPVGSFDGPANGATGVQGAIPVTGWAFDDIGIQTLQLWRDPVNGDPPPASNGKIFIGDATFVAGARPDVEVVSGAYYQSPNHATEAYRAAWGYMLLTNMLPNVNTGAPAGGVGTFTIYPYAVDVEGHVTSLGSRTFTADNTSATKPFGTIDTPTQGQTVSGTIDNWGWVLTPQPAVVPTDGSTITLYVDGAPQGTAQYNLPRSDIQSLFPGYANTDGAIAHFTIDTTLLANGLHTIFWVATDNLGRSEGIGSRYFTVQN
jgi:hypothetical protein